MRKRFVPSASSTDISSGPDVSDDPKDANYCPSNRVSSDSDRGTARPKVKRAPMKVKPKPPSKVASTKATKVQTALPTRKASKVPLRPFLSGRRATATVEVAPKIKRGRGRPPRVQRASAPSPEDSMVVPPPSRRFKAVKVKKESSNENAGMTLAVKQEVLEDAMLATCSPAYGQRGTFLKNFLNWLDSNPNSQVARWSADGSRVLIKIQEFLPIFRTELGSRSRTPSTLLKQLDNYGFKRDHSFEQGSNTGRPSHKQAEAAGYSAYKHATLVRGTKIHNDGPVVDTASTSQSATFAEETAAVSSSESSVCPIIAVRPSGKKRTIAQTDEPSEDPQITPIASGLAPDSSASSEAELGQRKLRARPPPLKLRPRGQTVIEGTRRSSRQFCKDAQIDPALLGGFDVSASSDGGKHQHIVIGPAVKSEPSDALKVADFYFDARNPLSEVYTEDDPPLTSLPPSAFHAPGLITRPVLPHYSPPTPVSPVLDQSEQRRYATEDAEMLVEELCAISYPDYETWSAGYSAPEVGPARWCTPSPKQEKLPWEPYTPHSAPASKEDQWNTASMFPGEPLSSSQPFFPDWIRMESSSDLEDKGMIQAKVSALEETLALDLSGNSRIVGKRPSQDLRYSYAFGWPVYHWDRTSSWEAKSRKGQGTAQEVIGGCLYIGAD